MKTLNLNNFRKITLVTLLLTVIGSSVFASGLKKMEPMPIAPVVSTNFEYLIYSLSIEEATEESLPVEDWMLNPDLFLDNEEEELELEAWMTDVDSFLDNESEPALVLEGWMMDLNAFEVEQDVALALENWMTDLNSFIPENSEPELMVENWMTDLDAFICNDVYALK